MCVGRTKQELGCTCVCLQAWAGLPVPRLGCTTRCSTSSGLKGEPKRRTLGWAPHSARFLTLGWLVSTIVASVLLPWVHILGLPLKCWLSFRFLHWPPSFLTLPTPGGESGSWRWQGLTPARPRSCANHKLPLGRVQSCQVSHPSQTEGSKLSGAWVSNDPCQASQCEARLRSPRDKKSVPWRQVILYVCIFYMVSTFLFSVLANFSRNPTFAISELKQKRSCPHHTNEPLSLTSWARNGRSQPVLACNSGRPRVLSEVNTLERVAKDRVISRCVSSHKGIHLEGCWWDRGIRSSGRVEMWWFKTKQHFAPLSGF